MSPVRSMSFPRLYAAASLKHPAGDLAPDRGVCFPRLYAAASLKHAERRMGALETERFSAALCRGLIEARHIRRQLQETT